MPDIKTNSFKLSVLLVTYNHENYIRIALDSLFNQKFDGLIELVIADDESSDNTISIIQEYENIDDRFIFKYLKNAKNMGITKNYQRGFSQCTGNYVAVLEGDDYWINPFKLQQQIDFLDIHLECNLCSVNYFVFQEEIAYYYPRIPVGSNYRLISARELIADNIVGNFSTCMYRKTALDNLPEKLFETTSYDWIINICIAHESFIGFLETPMSVYRLHTSGTWTQKSNVEKLQQQLNLIPIYDELTKKVFHRNFEDLASHLNNMIIGTQINDTLIDVIAPVSGKLSKIKGFIPPIILMLINLIIPPIIKQKLIKILKGRSV